MGGCIHGRLFCHVLLLLHVNVPVRCMKSISNTWNQCQLAEHTSAVVYRLEKCLPKFHASSLSLVARSFLQASLLLLDHHYQDFWPKMCVERSILGNRALSSPPFLQPTLTHWTGHKWAAGSNWSPTAGVEQQVSVLPLLLKTSCIWVWICSVYHLIVPFLLLFGMRFTGVQPFHIGTWMS